MDGEDVGTADFATCLKDLAAANGLTLGRRPTLAWLAGVVTVPDFSLLDVGFGHGDMLRAIARRWPAARLTGIDLNPRSAPAARRATPESLRIQYVTGDATTAGLPRPDYIVTSLVAHHMRDDELIEFLRWQEATAVKGWFVNDLHRHPVAYHGFAALAWAMRWHRFVRHDGPLSVARAFRRTDWEKLLQAAGITGAEVRWRFPFRLCVGRLK